MRLRLYLFAIVLLSVACLAATWGKFNNITVGSSGGNVGKYNNVTIGTTTGNIGAWNALTSPGGGGGGTITALTGTHATASSITQTGIASGDLVLVTASSNNATPAFTWSCITGCSSSGTISGTNFSSPSPTQNGGMWAIANTTSVLIEVTANCSSDCEMASNPFHSTTGWNTSSFATGTAATVTDHTSPTPIVGVSVGITGSSCVVEGEFAQENNATTFSASSPWSLGQLDGNHVDASVYQINVGTGTYSPAILSGSSAGSVWASISFGMCTN